jgi:hypothetical protein
MVALVMIFVAFVVFMALVALPLSFPAKATLKENATIIAEHTIIPIFVEPFIFTSLRTPSGF